MLNSVKNVIVHQLYAAASNGVLKRGVKAMYKEFPEYIPFIKTCYLSKSPTIQMPLKEINTVANAFRANRIAAGIQDSFRVLV